MDIFKNIKKNIAELNSILNSLDAKSYKIFKLLCVEALKSSRKGSKILFCGNGGSAADAQHLAAELMVRYRKNRSPISAISLSTDTSILTAIGNDYNFSNIFSRQIEGIGRKGDLLLIITTSGNSKNLIEAAKTAKNKKIKVFCFSGNKGGKIKKSCKNLIIIPSKNTSLIQVVEIFLGQILCEYLEERNFLRK
tara:strand:+ start:917 stop:1498 length:582 start_codon:yes stop_codon:yes gene_type:complete